MVSALEIHKIQHCQMLSATVVNFQVNVQFCQDRCNPVDCGEGVQSYGKRRRRRDSEQTKTNVSKIVGP